ncbi:hypothetical protein GP486_002894 [Trichoglossum hirsutum]|uniref:NIMA interactive protein n=1 Tax=Trichoglossum hirsutum TaxID=265104 RepID=A0A9P8RR94_9PEZI|nr:hypothetical protein GP486_002894 [Trichoglossum hirsutum]
MTIRSLRSNETKQSLEIERLRNRNMDLDRQLSVAQGQERAFKATLRTAENSARSLRDEMLRLKAMLQQVRTQCANDIRKRDIQIQRLKSHLGAQQRGSKPPLTNSTITITPSSASNIGLPARDEASLDSPNYSLAQETTEFLTQLSQNLSNENDNLIGLVRSTLITLRSLQGLPSPSPVTQEVDVAVPIGDELNGEIGGLESNPLHALPTSYDALSTDMDDVLDHLRTLLTNPSFVPIEELVAREDEITRLREGWEKMESRWRDAVAMMDSWRKKIAESGGSVNVDELRIGLGLKGGDPEKVDRTARFTPRGDVEEGVESGLYDDDDDDEENPEPKARDLNVDEVDEEISEEDEPLGVGLQPDGLVLGELNTNIQSSTSTQKDACSTIEEENTQDLVDEDEVALLNTSAATAEMPAPPGNQPPERTKVRFAESRIPRHTQKRIPPSSSAPTGKPNHPPSTTATTATTLIQQKLDGAKAEADAAVARRRAALSRPNPQATAAAVGGKKITSGKTARRRSTLSPEELETLITGGGETGG